MIRMLEILISKSSALQLSKVYSIFNKHDHISYDMYNDKFTVIENGGLNKRIVKDAS